MEEARITCGCGYEAVYYEFIVSPGRFRCSSCRMAWAVRWHTNPREARKVAEMAAKKEAAANKHAVIAAEKSQRRTAQLLRDRLAASACDASAERIAARRAECDRRTKEAHLRVICA